METILRMFELYRDEDLTGVSGTGKISEGIQFSDGAVAMRWCTDVASTAIYGSIDDVIQIHGHHGKTRLEWLSEYVQP